MKLERRLSLPLLALGALVICAWCSLLSGVAGWVSGRDLGIREGLAEAGVAGSALPPLGVLVTRVERNGPSDRAGIQRGDVIVALDDAHVDDVPALRRRLGDYVPGQTVRLGVLREAGELQLSVQLGAAPSDASRPYLGVYFTARAEDPADL